MKRKSILCLIFIAMFLQAFSVFADNKNPDINKSLLDASKKMDLKAVSDFIKLGADVNTRGENGFTPLIAVAAEKCKDEECYKNKIAISQLLLKNGADIDAVTADKNTALVYAVINRDSDMIQFLIENGISKEMPAVVINSLVINAAKSKEYEKELVLLKYLFEQGVNFEKTWNGLTPLLNVLHTSMDNTNLAYELIKMGVNTHVADKDGQTALMWAAANPDSRAFKYILSVSKPEEINKRSKSKSTALHWACRNGLAEHASLLIKAGADVDPKDELGNTPLLLTTDVRDEVLLKNHTDTAKVLLENGADVNSANKMGDSALTLVSEFSSPEYLSLLLKHGADPSHCNKYGISAVFKLASKGNTKAIELLCKYKADVNTTDRQGTSPLIEAIRRNHAEAAMALLNCGADINHISKTGDAAIHIAAETEDAFPVLQRLIDMGANINLKGPRGKTPLMESIYSKNCSAIKKLLGSGADIHPADNQGKTALHYAVEWETGCDVTRRLIGMGADVNAKSKNGETPLMITKSLENAKQLIAAGADLTITDSRGMNALDYARLSRRNDIAEYLKGIKKR